MNYFDEFRYGFAAARRPISIIFFMVLTAIAVITAGTFGVLYLANHERVNAAENAPAKLYTNTQYAGAFVSMLGCLADGPKKCSGYASAKQELVSVAPSGFPYQSGDGSQHLLGKAPSDAAVQSMAQGVVGNTRRGVKPSSLTSDADKSSVIYPISYAGKNVRMKMTIDVTNTSIVLSGIKVAQ